MEADDHCNYGKPIISYNKFIKLFTSLGQKNLTKSKLLLITLSGKNIHNIKVF